MQILGEDDNLSDNFGPYVNKESALQKLEIKADNKYLIGKSLDTRSHTKNILLEHIF